MKAITIRGTLIRLDEIANDLRALQHAVDGYIETVGLRDGAVMIVDEEGLLKGKPYNTLASLIAQNQYPRHCADRRRRRRGVRRCPGALSHAAFMRRGMRKAASPLARGIRLQTKMSVCSL